MPYPTEYDIHKIGTGASMQGLLFNTPQDMDFILRRVFVCKSGAGVSTLQVYYDGVSPDKRIIQATIAASNALTAVDFLRRIKANSKIYFYLSTTVAAEDFWLTFQGVLAKRDEIVYDAI
jgi:hypothetical protein